MRIQKALAKIMKKTYLLIVGVFCILQCNAQDLSTPATKARKFRVGVYTSIDFNLSEPSYVGDDFDGLYKIDATFDKFNYSLGLTTEYRLTQYFSMNTGVNYTNKDYSATINSDLSLPRETAVRLHHIEIPISARFYLPLNRISMFGEVGAINQFAQQEFATVTDSGYAVAAKLGAGVELKLPYFIALQLGLELQKGITTNRLNDMKLKNKVVGIRIGIVKAL